MQLRLNLKSVANATTKLENHLVGGQVTTGFFDFPGRLQLRDCSRVGQFQYRYGRKVQPKDWTL